MQSATSPLSPRKKLKSPFSDVTVNPKTSITCSNVPDSLFDPATVKKHFSKFGKVLKIKFYAKRHMCIVEYEHSNSAERALLNAGAFDGFMFDVTRSKPRVRRRSSRKDDDPDWVPDSDVEEELSAMGSTPTYRVTRQNTMDESSTSAPAQPPRMKVIQRTIKQSPLKKKLPVKEKKSVVMQSALSILEPPVIVTMTQTNLSTPEAAAELYQLCSKISLTSDEKWRVLDARDKILRAWGGAGSRIKVGGATIGTCQDMCPEKELLQRQAEHQVMTLETVVGSDGELESWRAVKQYSRSSADQDIPMCYELRPANILLRTIAYLLHEIADTTRQVSMADWFHFMWDRLRGIRKDITQQALCCADSICLVEMCARFHAHCAARLADLEHTQFDQKLNTDNLTKCLQTLKHMYADVSTHQKPREAEFRGYVALLNLGDANFWWEIKQLPEAIQKSEPILFAIKAFNAIDNNNYVRFFRLIKKEATYLQACILLRYFNDVRARALARIVKAYAPRGGSRYPALDMIRILAFESVESLKSFINHYGLRFARTDDSELSVILDRNQFIEDSDPYPIARAIKLIESKRNCTVGEIIAGGTLPDTGYKQHIMYTSFASDGRLKESALVAEDQAYNTTNDSNKDVKALKTEIVRLTQGGKTYATEKAEPNLNTFAMSSPNAKSGPNATQTFVPINSSGDTKLFSFKPAIPVAPTEVIKNSPEKIFSADKNTYSFSKPQETENIFVGREAVKSIFDSQTLSTKSNIFSNPIIDLKRNSQPTLEGTKSKDNIFKNVSDEKPIFTKTFENKSSNLFSSTRHNIFSANENKANNQSPFGSKNIFATKTDPIIENKSLFGGTNLFTAKENKNTENQTLGAKNVFASAKTDSFSKSDNTSVFVKSGNIFAKPAVTKEPSSIFGAFVKPPENNNLFAKTDTDKAQALFSNDKGPNAVSPASLFKSILNGSDTKNYSIFQSKNKAQTVADNILNSVTATNSSLIYDFNQNDHEEQNKLAMKKLQEQKQEEERILQEKIKKEEENRKEALRQQEEEKLKEEARKKQIELKLLEEKRKKEEQKKKELKKKLEQEKKDLEQAKAAELKRKVEEDRKFKEQVDKVSVGLIEELIDEVNKETVKDILKEELESFNSLMLFAGQIMDDIISNISREVCESEMKAEQFLTQKIMKKWFYVWRERYVKNIERRNMLDDTPVWLTRYTPEEEAACLKRIVENAALKNMNAIHKGYRFSSELKQLPTPEPYNVIEIIRSPLLKRMKQICYPYDKCFFWKITLILPSSTKWLYRRIDVEKWLLNVFSDGKKHESDNLIRVEKQSWNHLMDFAISVGITSKVKNSAGNEAIDGANALLFYATERDNDLVNVIESTLKHKYPYQIVPIAVILPNMENDSVQSHLEVLLADLVKRNVILAYRIFVIGAQTVFESLHVSTKTAMKWLAKKYPKIPPLEIDSLKSICQRYLGNEIWCMLRSNIDSRMNVVIKDLFKLVKCYNSAVEKLTEIITNEDLFNYPSFPLEFQPYLDSTSPYPKPFEFIPSSVKTSDNISAIKRIMKQLKMPDPSVHFNPVSAISMKEQITSYCNQIGWFENTEEIVCKVVAVLPTELSNRSIHYDDFRQYYAHYNLLDFMNIIVYEKINTLKNFENRFAVYERSLLENYRNGLWLHEINVIKELKHKALEYEDEVDFAIEAKRRKIAMDSLECLMLEDKDRTLVEEQIKENDLSICKYNNCTEAVKQLEQMLDAEKIKSMQFENLLKAALDGH